MSYKYLSKILGTGAVIASTAILAFSTPAMAWSECNGNPSGGNEGSVTGRAPGHSNSPYGSQVRKAKHQIGDRSNTCYADGSAISNVNAFNDHFWQSASGSTMFFNESGDSFRSELREEREFRVDDNDNDYVRTRARIIRKRDGLEEVTIAQLHSEDSRGPVARLAWVDSGVVSDVNGNSPEGMWLSIRQSPTCSGGSTCFSHTYVGNIDGSYRTYRLGLWGSRLRLSVNGSYIPIVREDIFDDDNDGNLSESKSGNFIELNGTAWDGKNLYLKAGAYVNSDGEARVGHRDFRFFE